MNLNIHNVSLSIKGRLIVDDVSITVNPGEVVGLMGPNGAGKTTTFNLAVGNIKPDNCLLYTSPSPRDGHQSRMPSSA